MKNLFLAIVVTMFSGLSMASTIIDFNAQIPSTNFGSVTESGFEIVGNGNYHFVSSGGSSFCSPPCPDNGTNYLLAHGATFTVKSEDDSLFSLQSFDGAESHSGLPQLWAEVIRVTGYKVSGSVSQDFTLDWIQDGDGGLADFQTFSFGTGFTDLTHVVFSGLGVNSADYFSIDNIAVNGAPVPAPAAAILLLTGLIGFRAARR